MGRLTTLVRSEKINRGGEGRDVRGETPVSTAGSPGGRTGRRSSVHGPPTHEEGIHRLNLFGENETGSLLAAPIISKRTGEKRKRARGSAFSDSRRRGSKGEAEGWPIHREGVAVEGDYFKEDGRADMG